MFTLIFSKRKKDGLGAHKPDTEKLQSEIPVCNPVVAQLVPYALPQPLFFLLLTWDFSLVPYH